MLEKGKVVFGNWTVEETIGSGAFGTVYKIKKEEFGRVYYSAMKVLEIPQDKEEHNRLRREGMDDASISTYYSQIAQDFIKEIELLSSLDGITNIVDYKDHTIEANDNMGYTIYIKMQLLTPIANTLLNADGSVRFMESEEILKLGKDMCSALEVCEKKKIIHRDIKIDNIFLSENGDYKLGDFGIARQLEATQGEMSKKGTVLYMAPEVFRGENYDKTVDIYSLGIVLYRLFNKNRAPFFPNYPDPIKFSDKEVANARRLKGDALPDIIGISAELNAVLKKACAFKPSDRYQSANEFKTALELVETAVAAPVVVAPEAPAVVEMEEKTESAFAPDFVAVEPVTPVAENTVDEDATVGVFNSAPIASAEPVVPITEDTMEEEKTESVFGNEREAILSDSFYEKETVTLESFDEEKTESAFNPAFVAENTVDEDATVGVFGTTPVASAKPVAPVVEDTMEDEKTESVFAPVVDEKKSENVASAKENTTKKSKSEGIIAIVSVIIVIAIIAGICGVVRVNQVEEYIPQETDQETTQTTPTLNEEGYYEIASAEDLFWFAEEVNSGNNLNANGILVNDIDLNPGYVFNSKGIVTYNGSTVTEGWAEWEPIGFEWEGSIMHYSGTFDGNGYTVSGVYFNRAYRYSVGFFGLVNDATIKNLNVTNSYITGYSSVGGIVGYNNYSNLSNCNFYGEVSCPYYYTGGIVGYNNGGTLNSCINEGNVSGANSTGGIIGYNTNNGLIESCENTGNVSGNVSYYVSTSNFTGGISGFNSGDIKFCNNSGSVGGYWYVGGITGDVYTGGVYSCQNSGILSGNSYIGGISGFVSTGNVESCKNTGPVSSAMYSCGGIIGENYTDGFIYLCENTGRIDGYNCTGGIVGSNGGTVDSCNNSGFVTGNEFVGAVVGYNGYWEAKVLNCS